MKLPRCRAAFILVRPRNPGNIGAAARVMANFGFSDLRVVSPHPPIWGEALKLAVDSQDLVRRAKVYKTLEEAVRDRARVYATSGLKGRTPHLPVRTLPGLRLKPGSAVVFGPENNGLSDDDMEFCDEVVCIPAHPKRPSLNLAQAVAVVCYELAARPTELLCEEVPPPNAVGGRPADAKPSRNIARLSRKRHARGLETLPPRGIERLIGEAEKAFVKLRYRPTMTPAERASRLRRLMRKRGVTREEGGMLSELLRRILER